MRGRGGIVGAGLLMLLTGCGMLPREHDPGVRLTLNQYGDLPVSDGLVLRGWESWSYQGLVRVGYFRYLGTGEIPDVVDFFSHHLPQNNWTTAEAMPALGWQVLAFRKGRDNLQVKLRKLRDERVELRLLVNATDKDERN